MRSTAPTGMLAPFLAHAQFYLLGTCLVLCASSHAQSILTVAGGGTDDGRPATVASLSGPGGVVLDGSGNLYIADTESHRIRKVTAATSVVTTVAGSGNPSFSGDGGPATRAGLYSPESVAVDSLGDLYIADTNNNRIRKITAATGIITTVAGNGSQVFSGDGGPATAASLSSPSGVALDSSGNLYIADRVNNRIRKVTAATGIITTVAGSGPSGFSGFSGDGGPATMASLWSPSDVALDGSGNLYIADDSNERVRKVTEATGIITTVAGSGSPGFRGFLGDGGPATAALLSPDGLDLDSSGNLYIADCSIDRIRKVTAASGIITTVAGSGNEGFSGDAGPATAASLSCPLDMALDGQGDLYIADNNNERIRKVTAASGIITTVAGGGAREFSGDGGPASAASLFSPWRVALDGSGNLYIVDNDLIRKVSAATGVITTVAGSGSPGFSGDGGPATRASFLLVRDVALDVSGNLYIADSFNNRIRKVTAATGVITTVAGSGNEGFSGDGGLATEASLSSPAGIALDGSGNLYFADSVNDRIRKVTAASGIIATVAGSGAREFLGDEGPATAASLFSPEDVAVDGSGNLYIADLLNLRIRKVTAASGIITTVAGNGSRGFSGDSGPATAASLSHPESVAVDDSGNLYIADSHNNRIRKVTVASGLITTVAGSGNEGFSGDGGPASAASLSAVLGVAVDGSGNLYIADLRSHRIRAVFACVNVGAPEIASPSDASRGVSTSPRLAWNAVREAFRYDVLLDTVAPPKQVVASDIATTTFAPSNLEPLTQYYWQVVAKGDPLCVPFSTSASPVRTFTTTASCSAPGSFDGASP